VSITYYTDFPQFSKLPRFIVNTSGICVRLTTKPAKPAQQRKGIAHETMRSVLCQFSQYHWHYAPFSQVVDVVPVLVRYLDQANVIDNRLLLFAYFRKHKLQLVQSVHYCNLCA